MKKWIDEYNPPETCFIVPDDIRGMDGPDQIDYILSHGAEEYVIQPLEGGPEVSAWYLGEGQFFRDDNGYVVDADYYRWREVEV